jgi:hypothetical protein
MRLPFNNVTIPPSFDSWKGTIVYSILPGMIIPTPWKTVILLCGKCARKLDGGFGHNNKRSLRAAMHTELKARGLRRQVRLIETRCMGVCPNKAVTALNAGFPGRVVTVPKKTRGDEALNSILWR